MKVFVIAREGQGVRQSDFCDAEEGELLTFAVECSQDEEDSDDNCGCRPSLLKLESGGATTTFTVTGHQLSPAEYEVKVVDYFASKGWFDRNNSDTAEISRGDATSISEEAAQFPIGIVLEKRGDKIQVRQPVQSTTTFMVARHRRSANNALSGKTSS